VAAAARASPARTVLPLRAAAVHMYGGRAGREVYVLPYLAPGDLYTPPVWRARGHVYRSRIPRGVRGRGVAVAVAEAGEPRAVWRGGIELHAGMEGGTAAVLYNKGRRVMEFHLEV